MSEGFPKPAHNDSNPLMRQVEQMQEETRQRERIKNFIDINDDASVKDFERTQDALARMENESDVLEVKSPDTESPDVEDPLDKGVFEDDVFYNNNTERVIAVGASRMIGDEKRYTITVETPTAKGRSRKFVREMTEDEAKSYIGSDGAQLIEGGYDRNIDVSSNVWREEHDSTRSTQGEAAGEPDDTSSENGTEHEYSPGQTIELSDGTTMKIIDRDEISGDFIVYEKLANTHLGSAILMGREELDGLVDDLKRTPEQSSELIRRVLAGEDNPDIAAVPQSEQAAPTVEESGDEASEDGDVHEYLPGQTIELPDGTVMKIIRQDDDTGEFIVHRKMPGAYLWSPVRMSREGLDSLSRGTSQTRESGATAADAPLSDEERVALENIAAQGVDGAPLMNATQGDEATANSPAVPERAAEDAERERRERIAEAIKRIEDEVDASELGEAVRSALSRYAELKADSETEGIRGRTRREKLLKEAEVALLQAHMAAEGAVVAKKREEALYDGDEETFTHQQADDMFNRVRDLDYMTRTATNSELDRRKQDRGPFKKAVAAVGRFFTSGSNVTQWAKSGGTGAVVGFGVSMSGAGFPVTAAVGIGAGAAVYHAAATANLDRIRSENVDAQGDAVTVMSDQQLTDEVTAARTEGKTSKEVAERIGNKIFDKSRERGYEQADRARSDAKRTLGKFALGFTAGGAAGALTHNIANFMDARAERAVGGGDASASIDTDGGAPDTSSGDSGNDAGSPEAPDGDASNNGDVSPSEPRDFAPGADKIASGEGWMHQFADMGMSTEQARALYGDTVLMDKLVDMGVAYPSSNPNIGAYGINLKDLTPEAMRIIGEAMTAKGF